MTTDPSSEPRCDHCLRILPTAGTICHVCDIDMHFEGVLRTAPPLFTREHAPEQPQRSVHRAS